MYGEALSAPGGIDRIRARMGVCPQFDILWQELTGREHVLLYGAIKVRPGLGPSVACRTTVSPALSDAPLGVPQASTRSAPSS